MRLPLLLLLSLIGIAFTPIGKTVADSANKPTYADSETRAIVEKMIDAHGGLATFKDAKSFNATIMMYMPPLGSKRSLDGWRYYEIAIDPRTSRGYVEMPWETGGGVRVAHTGSSMWTAGFEVMESPMLLLYNHYSIAALPWLTQNKGVHLQLVKREALPGFPSEHYVINVTFKPEGGSHGGEMDLFIDPDTHLLRGYTHSAMLPILPGNVLPSEFPPMPEQWHGMTRIVDAYQTVDGLVVPRTYITVTKTDEGYSEASGFHAIHDFSATRSFDNTKLKKPEGAQVIMGQ